MRLFIAIRLSEPIRAALIRAQEDMRAQRVAGRYAPPENLHLTLAFIGEYPDGEDVLEVLPAFRPFPLRLSGYGAFGDLWWAGIERSAELTRYAGSLRRALSGAGIPFDRKRFSPHITLVRGASGTPVLELPETEMTVSRISLMRSDRGKNGMVYTEIGGIDAD